MPIRRPISRLILASLAIASVAAPSDARAQAPGAIPASPAGRLLKQWLDLFNRADSAGLDRFLKAHAPNITAQVQMQSQRSSGGIEIARILTAEPLHITFTARGKESPLGMRGNFE